IAEYPGQGEDSAENAQEEVDKAVSQVEDVVRRLNDSTTSTEPWCRAAKTVGFVEAGKTASWTSGSTTNVRAPEGASRGSGGRRPLKERRRLLQPEASSRKQPILDSAMDIADAISKLLQYAQLAQKELALKNAEANATCLQLTLPGRKHSSRRSQARGRSGAPPCARRPTPWPRAGPTTEDRLISASKQVAASTAQLLVESKVASRIRTPRPLGDCRMPAQSVKRATERLVAEAQSAIDKSELRPAATGRLDGALG
uniref:I/LWEQ domain-containing protein n=1 Tax=Macrostomum lignano TaxID=282301 RepID=A0A1I8FKJ2_9PLAT